MNSVQNLPVALLINHFSVDIPHQNECFVPVILPKHSVLFHFSLL